MGEEENQDNVEEPQDAEAAGPVAEDGPPADSPEDPPSTPPADEAPEAPAEDSEQAEEAAAEAQPDDAPAEDASADEPAAADSKAEGDEGSGGAKPADLPPGAELDPITLEPERELSAEEKARREAEAEERARREAELVGEAKEEPAAASRAPAKMESGARYLATGKRKNSIARVTLEPGKGQIVVNARTLEEYFPRPLHQAMARQPLAATGYEGNVDVRIRVHGGGISGQAGAVRHGIARALTEIDAELRGDLKRRGFLTRDARVKERRKAGLKKARKRPQFSKR